MIVTQYRMTATCDTCGKKVVSDSIDSPPRTPVPVDWIQTAPPGTTVVREFCSVECMSDWKGQMTKPWTDDETGEPVE